MPRRHRPSSRRYGVPRRDFLRYVAAMSALPNLAYPNLTLGAQGEPTTQPAFNGNPFSLGVASGDPVSDGVVIWTRLATDPLQGGGLPPLPVRVEWEVADDEAFAKVVRKGSALAMPQLGHSVHVEVDGLDPHRWYFYRFHVGGETSPVGRTRTAPAADALPDRLKFAFTSCQHYESGYFNGYPHMQQEDLDLVVHLGDYIYEYAGNEKQVRKHIGPECTTLDQYRTRYSQYRLDENVRETHRLFPWLVTWDDHEFDNNYANLVSEEEGISPEEFLARRMNAYQVYYEFMPLRRRSLPRGPHMQLYRGAPYGRLANFQMLDTRQYRTDQPNGDHQKPMTGEALSKNATMLGERQEHWLMRSLLETNSVWNILAQQVVMAPLNRGTPEEPLYSMDQWPGYEVSRRRLLRFFHERKIPNPVVLTGDIHVNWVNDLQLDFHDPNSPVVGTEFVGTSMSSGGNGGKSIPEYERALAQCDFAKWYNANRGYVSCEVTPEKWISYFRTTPFVDRPGSPINTSATFVVEANHPGAKPA